METFVICHSKDGIYISKGLKCFGHALGATGLRMVYEVYKQMQGKAGARRCKNSTLGMTHNHGMNPGSAVGSVTVLGQRDSSATRELCWRAGGL